MLLDIITLLYASSRYIILIKPECVHYRVVPHFHYEVLKTLHYLNYLFYCINGIAIIMNQASFIIISLYLILIFIAYYNEFILIDATLAQ